MAADPARDHSYMIAPKSTTCFVARQDEVTFLKPAGYRRVRAIGLPIIYTQPSGLQRIPKSLLVMPTHSLASDVLMLSTEQYVLEIASIKDRFGLVPPVSRLTALRKAYGVLNLQKKVSRQYAVPE